jgi:hypothetical protein
MIFLFILLLDIAPDRFATLFEPGCMPPLMMSGLRPPSIDIRTCYSIAVLDSDDTCPDCVSTGTQSTGLPVQQPFAGKIRLL